MFRENDSKIWEIKSCWIHTCTLWLVRNICLYADKYYIQFQFVRVCLYNKKVTSSYDLQWNLRLHVKLHKVYGKIALVVMVYSEICAFT